MAPHRLGAGPTRFAPSFSSRDCRDVIVTRQSRIQTQLMANATDDLSMELQLMTQTLPTTAHRAMESTATKRLERRVCFICLPLLSAWTLYLSTLDLPCPLLLSHVRLLLLSFIHADHCPLRDSLVDYTRLELNIRLPSEKLSRTVNPDSTQPAVKKKQERKKKRRAKGKQYMVA
jgi:hypothetical protein